jgi:hypothetical protein
MKTIGVSGVEFQMAAQEIHLRHPALLSRGLVFHRALETQNI